MKILKIKTIWQDCATMRDKYWAEIKEKECDLQFVYVGDTERYVGQKMTIPFAEIARRVFRRAKMKVDDRYSNQQHILLYFEWIPDTPQKKLI